LLNKFEENKNKRWFRQIWEKMDQSRVGDSAVGSILAMKSIAAKQVREESRQLRRRKVEQQNKVKNKTAQHRENRKQKQCGLHDVMRQTLSSPFPESPSRPRPHTTHQSARTGERESQKSAKKQAAIMPQLKLDQARYPPSSPERLRPASAMSSLPNLHRSRRQQNSKARTKESAEIRLDTIAKHLEHRLKTENRPAKPKSPIRSVRGAYFGLPHPVLTEGPEYSPIGGSSQNKHYSDEIFPIDQDDQVVGLVNEIKEMEDETSRGWQSSGNQGQNARDRKINSSSLVHRQNIQHLNGHVGTLRDQIMSSQDLPMGDEYHQLASELYLRHATGQDEKLRPDGTRRSTPSLEELQEAYNIAKLRDPNVFKRVAHKPGQWRHNAKLPAEGKMPNKTFVTTLQLGINSSA